MILFPKSFWLLVLLLFGVQAELIYAQTTQPKAPVEQPAKAQAQQDPKAAQEDDEDEEDGIEEAAEKAEEDEADDEAVVEQPVAEAAAPPRILGWKEWVWVVKPEFVLRAKLDTGARTNSIHATNVETLELDGERWVKFTISDPREEKGMRLRHKAPIARVALIKNDTGGLDERFVVSLPVHVAGEMVECEFTLNDRHNMNYAVLIGRNLLQQIGAVDSSKKYLWDQPVNLKKAKAPKKSKSSKP